MAHQFIEEIKRVIESSLPSSSAIVGKVITTIVTASSSAKDLAQIIELDPPLAANLLKVANSAYYGSTGNITSIQRAIVVLGFDTIKEIVTTAAVIESLNDVHVDDDIDRLGLWNHSIGTAKACQIIAKKTSLERPEVAYIVGLLHDIGKILLSISFPKEYSNTVNFAVSKNTRIILAERKILNTDHAMIGKVLCDIWAIPEKITTAILYHHDPMEVQRGSQKLARIVELGDFMCRKAEIGNPGDNSTQEVSPATFGLLGRDRNMIKQVYMEIFNELYKSKNEIKQIFAQHFV